MLNPAIAVTAPRAPHRSEPWQALEQVSLEVHPGEVVTLIGANGAGKSTTLRSISRIVPIHRGRIAFDARDISGARPSDVVRMGIAQVPEGRRMLARQSVVDNLLLGAYTRSDGAEIQADLERQFPPPLFPRPHAACRPDARVLGQAGGGSNAQQQQARGEGIQCAGVADAPRAQRAAGPGHHVV